MKEDGRIRVWKACDRCRVKKIKCSGEFPCENCTDVGFICTQKPRKIKYKDCNGRQLELLENSHRVLLSMVRKLYAMIRNSEAWSLPEPDLNSGGEPTIHSIAELLGCTHPSAVVEQPAHRGAPEEKHAGITLIGKGEPGGGIDMELDVATAEMGSLNVKTSFDDILASTLASPSTSPRESSQETRHENSPVFQAENGDYTIAQQTAEISRQFNFGYSPITVEGGHPLFTYPETSMTEMSDICGYLIPAWNDIANSYKAQ